MIDNNSEYEEKLNLIRKFREDAYKLDTVILLILVLGIISQYLISFLAPLFGVLAFLVFYKRLEKAAHYPCPKCCEPFGTNTKIVLGVGSASCQNCGLNLNT